MAKLFGNVSGWNWRGGAKGIGATNVGPFPFSLVHVAGAQDEVIALDVAQFSPNHGEVGLVVQSSGTVSMKFSLTNPEISASPDSAIRANAVWTTPESVAANKIVQVNDGLPFVVVEITFTEAAIVSFHTR